MLQDWFRRPARATETLSPSASDPAASAPLIELRQVVKTYATPAGDFTALKNVDLQVNPHEFVAVIGKSGSGKSTLINTVTGIDRPTSGEVLVCGTPIHTLDESKLAVWRGRNVGVIFQFFQLLPTLTLIENVMLPMELGRLYTPRVRRARAIELLDQVGMADKADRLPAAISGGQQQRVAIARALANDPDVLVADEPTGSLDARTADAVFDIFERFVAQGKTMLMVTHDRDLASRVSRVVLIADGEIMDQQLAQALPMLTRPEMVMLATRLEPITFQPGSVIVRQNDPADHFYILLKGQADVLLERAGQSEAPIARLLSGQFFGEAGLLQGGRRTATVRAWADSEVVVVALDRAAFSSMLAGSEPTREEIARAMHERLADLQGFGALEARHA
jgi:ABC-type lipoprotein export system ATPase subunit